METAKTYSGPSATEVRCAWRKMNIDHRASFLAWVLEEADASGVGYGLVSIEQMIHGVPFRRMTIDAMGEQRFLVNVEDGDENFEQWLTADEVKGGK